MKEPQKVSEAVIKQTIDDTFRQVLEENSLALWTPNAMLDLLRRMDLSPDEKVVQGMTIAQTLGIDSPGEYMTKVIKTQEQLDAAVEALRGEGRKIPTFLRKAYKQAGQSLPRRGGPGRSALLTPQEAAIMCDQVSLFYREKNSLKKSLQMAAELSPKLLGGKKVGPRTLHKHWIKRDEYPADSKH
jgi:hypothetical protein